MAETRVLAPVLRLVEHAGGKAVLVGDPAQLPAVGAGGLYAALCERLGAGAWSRTAASARRPSATRWRAFAPATPRATSATPPGQGRLLVADDATRQRSSSSPTGGARPPRATCARA